MLRKIFSENENDRPTAEEIRDYLQALLEIDYYESDEEDTKRIYYNKTPHQNTNLTKLYS